MSDEETEITFKTILEFVSMLLAFACLGLAALSAVALEFEIAANTFIGFLIFGWFGGFFED